MAITTQSFLTLVRQQAAAIQAKASVVLSFVVGSIELARVEATSAVAMWLQSIVLELLATTRLSTSTGTDADSFVADFSMPPRAAAVAAVGHVLFSRFTATNASIIPAGVATVSAGATTYSGGAMVQTTDGTQQFQVIPDLTQAYYSAATNSYTIPAGISSGSVTVQAVTAGALSNVNANAITTISSAIVGVDTVNNTAAFVNGSDAETDAAMQIRFVAYIASLEKGTAKAVKYAVTAMQAGATCAVVENLDYNGTVDYGYFYAVVDDGTGVPSSTFLSSAANVIDAIRSLTIRFGVFAPAVVNATVVMTATVAAGYNVAATKALAQTAVTAYINALQLGQTLPFTRLAQAAYDASPGIINITGVTLNGGTVDLTATVQQIIKALSVTVS